MAAMAQRRHAAEIRRALRELICLSLELSGSQQSTGELRGKVRQRGASRSSSSEDRSWMPS